MKCLGIAWSNERAKKRNMSALVPARAERGEAEIGSVEGMYAYSRVPFFSFDFRCRIVDLFLGPHLQSLPNRNTYTNLILFAKV